MSSDYRHAFNRIPSQPAVPRGFSNRPGKWYAVGIAVVQYRAHGQKEILRAAFGIGERGGGGETGYADAFGTETLVAAGHPARCPVGPGRRGKGWEWDLSCGREEPLVVRALRGRRNRGCSRHHPSREARGEYFAFCSLCQELFRFLFAFVWQYSCAERGGKAGARTPPNHS